MNTAVYLIGGVMFIWGSVLFFPALEARSDHGVWVLLVASLMYVAVTGHDFLEVLRYRAHGQGDADQVGPVRGVGRAQLSAGQRVVHRRQCVLPV